MAETPCLKSLILVGGQSSRMGSPKYLLPMPFATEEIPLIVHIVKAHLACHESAGRAAADSILVSVRDRTQQEELELLFKRYLSGHAANIIYVCDTKPNQGPSIGLITAHHSSQEAHLLATGCDYPLLDVDALTCLASNHLHFKKAITCFRNAHGMYEPLLAVWSPVALSCLVQLSNERGNVGPNRVIRMFATDESLVPDSPAFSSGVNELLPVKESWLRSVNTKEEWRMALAELKHAGLKKLGQGLLLWDA